MSLRLEGILQNGSWKEKLKVLRKLGIHNFVFIPVRGVAAMQNARIRLKEEGLDIDTDGSVSCTYGSAEICLGPDLKYLMVYRR